ncbi:MAG: TolC family protein [Acidobacteria bacterium]|nr:TolC family protein [Acidobacteriota bacterium]
MNKSGWTTIFLMWGVWHVSAPAALHAQETEGLTIQRAVALALQNSRELALARAQQFVAERTVSANRSQFLPNFYTGSGAAYTNGFPQTPGGAAPSVFNLSYIQALFNPPLRGQLRAAEERREVQRLNLEQVRGAVILRTVSAYLELAKGRHSLGLLRRERESARKILNFTRERVTEGLELPIEVTRSEVAAARVEQRIARVEGHDEVLEEELRSLTGIVPDRLELVPEKLGLESRQSIPELVDLAITNNVELQQAEHELRAREHRLEGERGGHWPSVDLVGEYSILSRLNNYDEFFRRFQRHNLNLGVQVRIPVYSAQTSAAVQLAQSELAAARAELENKRFDLTVEVRRQAGRTREANAAREVARLELKLAGENVRLLQARFDEGRANLRDLERARLEENDKWLAFLDTEHEYQQAQLQLFKNTGRLASIFP